MTRLLGSFQGPLSPKLTKTNRKNPEKDKVFHSKHFWYHNTFTEDVLKSGKTKPFLTYILWRKSWNYNLFCLAQYINKQLANNARKHIYNYLQYLKDQIVFLQIRSFLAMGDILYSRNLAKFFPSRIKSSFHEDDISARRCFSASHHQIAQNFVTSGILRQMEIRLDCELRGNLHYFKLLGIPRGCFAFLIRTVGTHVSEKLRWQQTWRVYPVP